MSELEVIHQLKLIRQALHGTVYITDKIVLYNPEINLSWDANGYLIEVRISGTDSSGITRTFRKTLTWDANGYLIKVSNWEEV